LSILVESVFVESVFVESVFVESVFVESLLVESLLVESLLVESLLVESLLVESLLVESLLVEYLFVDWVVSLLVGSLLVEVSAVLCVEVVVHWHVVEVSVDLRTGLRLVDVVEVDRDVVVGVSLSRIEESVFVQSWVWDVLFDLHPHSLQAPFPSTKAT